MRTRRIALCVSAQIRKILHQASAKRELAEQNNVFVVCLFQAEQVAAQRRGQEILLLPKTGLQESEQFILSVRGFMAGLIRIAEVSDKVIKINEPQNKLDAGILDLFHFILLRPRKIIAQLIQPNAVHLVKECLVGTLAGALKNGP